MIGNLLKLSESIKAELVPGIDNYLDKKGFSWEVVSYNDIKIGLKFTYDHPEYISVGKPDTMKISFYNTEAWVVPLNE